MQYDLADRANFAVMNSHRADERFGAIKRLRAID